MKNKFLCLHGHFYQPPRENPWTGAIEPEESARPYSDWNEKIFQQCYGPNSACPLIGEDGLINDMADNYAKMSFDFGPTLLIWLEREHPLVYKAILAADKKSCAALDGHGNAIAHPYYHAILPLQSRRDKAFLVRWGIADFKARFGREPEGMWLPETAVDEETLEVLIEEGIKFTILAPSQAARVRDLGAADWREVAEETLLPTRPYRWVSRADKNRHIALFFYHRLLHESVDSGEAFSSDQSLYHKALARFLPDDSTQIVSSANDGEFYGHHRRAGAAGLAATFRLAESSGLAITNYAHYLSLFPPPQEVDIKPRTAWSCVHGLGRWSADCGCRHAKGTSQAWRGPLREALDWLARELDRVYAAKAGAFLKDFLVAREAYCERLTGESARFLEAHALPGIPAGDRAKGLALLEMEKSRLAMYTSCGWFFDEPSGLETPLILRHAARAALIADEFGAQTVAGFKERLAAIPCGDKRFKTAADLFDRLVLPARADAPRAAAHYAILDHIGFAAPPTPNFSAAGARARLLERMEPAGKDRYLSWGVWEVRDAATQGSQKLLAVVHQLDRVDIRCRVGAVDAASDEELADAFQTMSAAELETDLSRRFSGVHYGIDALFGSARLDLMRQLMPAPVETPERAVFRAAWSRAAAALRREGHDDALLELLGQARGLRISIDQLPWSSVVRAALPRLLEALLEDAAPERLSRAARWISAFEDAGLHADVWELQQFVWRWRARLQERPAAALEREALLALGEKLRFQGGALVSPDAAAA
jgi:alpha-amylase/alpha-mannosidase (GH57 family)